MVVKCPGLTGVCPCDKGQCGKTKFHVAGGMQVHGMWTVLRKGVILSAEMQAAP